MTSETSCRPELSPVLARTMVHELYGLHVRSVKELDSYTDRNFHLMVDAHNFSNDFLKEVCAHGYVLKVLNSVDSMNSSTIEGQNAIMEHVCRKGIVTPPIVRTTRGQQFVMCSLDRKEGREYYEVVSGNHTKKYAVRLLEYLPGTTLCSVPLTSHLCFKVGQLGGMLAVALQDFDDSNYSELGTQWRLENVPSLRHRLQIIKDPETRSVIHDIIGAFEEKVLNAENRQNFPAGIIHKDLNDHNILIENVNNMDLAWSRSSKTLNGTLPKFAQSSTSETIPSQAPLTPTTLPSSGKSEEWRVCGLLDFGDTTKSFLFVELAVAMSHIVLTCPEDCDPVGFMGHALAGYLSKKQLSKGEIQPIPLAVCARLCQLVIVCSQGSKLDPKNIYILNFVTSVGEHILRLWNTPTDVIFDNWKCVVNSYGLVYPE